jgi:hypothetical protein
MGRYWQGIFWAGMQQKLKIKKKFLNNNISIIGDQLFNISNI